MNYDALKWALLRAFIPTLTLLAIILFCTLSWSKTFALFTGSDYTSGLIRFLIMIGEALWVWWLYNYKNKKK